MNLRVSSAAIHQDLENADDLDDFLARNAENLIRRNLSKHLKMLLKQRGLKRADVVRDSGLEKAYVYQIFDGKKRPSRDKLIAIAFGLHLNNEETQRMLKLGGCSDLYAREERDAVIFFAIKQGMDITVADDLLYSKGHPTLLDPDK